MTIGFSNKWEWLQSFQRLGHFSHLNQLPPMNTREAQLEFCLRLYRWAQEQFDKEAEGLFPSFAMNNDWVRYRCRFFGTLDSASKTAFRDALLHRRHEDVAKSLGEHFPGEAPMLLALEDAFRTQVRFSKKVAAHSIIASHSLASRREIRKTLEARFKAEFGQNIIPINVNEEGHDLRFHTLCRGWTIQTGFEFGRWDPEITYFHDVWTGEKVNPSEEPLLFANCLGFHLNYGNELGIGSGWDNIQKASLDRTCDEVLAHCRKLMDIFPALLDGLDLDIVLLKTQ